MSELKFTKKVEITFMASTQSDLDFFIDAADNALCDLSFSFNDEDLFDYNFNELSEAKNDE